MGFRFQRRVRLGKHVTLNLSKGGVSTSLGVRGARVTVGRSRVRKTVGLPGTGLSFTETSSTRVPASQSADGDGNLGSALVGVGLLILILWFLF